MKPLTKPQLAKLHRIHTDLDSLTKDVIAKLPNEECETALDSLVTARTNCRVLLHWLAPDLLN